MAWFKNRPAHLLAADRPLEKPDAAALLARAQESRAEGDLFTAQSLAKEALAEGVRTHGERHAALVPFLLVYAGLLNQCLGWSQGKPFYDWAQRLRGLTSQLR